MGAPNGMVNRLVPTLVMAFCLAPSLLAQVFRSGVDLRVIDVVVTGSDGRPVTGLGVDDFDVSEDSERRAVRFVTPVSMPDPPSADRELDAPGDVWTNVGTASRRIFAVVLDDLSTRASDTAKARYVVRRFIERVPDGDLVSIVFTGQQTGAQEFTSDKARLGRILENYVGRNPMPDLDSITGDDPSGMTMMQRGMARGETKGNFERTLQTLVNVSEWLSSVEDRRKAILFVTAGLSPTLASAFLGGLDGPRSLPDGPREFAGGAGAAGLFTRLVAQAALANVALYPLDYQGLSTPFNREMSNSTLGAISELAVMADETGGVAAIHTNDVDGLFDTMIRDSSAYYLIGYEPSAGQDDPNKALAHRITIRTRTPGQTIRSRTSYVSGPKPTAQASKRAATHLLSSPLPGGPLDVRLQAAVFAKGDNKGRVVAVLDVAGDRLAVDESGRGKTISLTYQLAATDVNGKVQAADTQTVTLRLSDERLGQIVDTGVRVVTLLDLKPGWYRVRAGVVNGDSHGVVAGDVDVPDYGKNGPGASAVLLASTDSARTPVRREDYGPFEGRLTAAPTSRRSFGPHERIETYLEVHADEGTEKRVTPEANPVVTAALRTASGTFVSRVPVTVGAREKGIGGGRVHPVRATLGMADLPAGACVLEFFVGADATVSTQRVVFTVRGS